MSHIEFQTTIHSEVSVNGRGLHTGEPSRLTLKPAPAYTGVVFRRVDLNNFEIPAALQYVARVSYATTLMRQGVMISTVEHLLSALVGAHIDNCLIEIDSLEVPILDGSARPFIDLIEQAGISILETPRQYFRILKHIGVDDSGRRISISPAPTFSISCTIEFPHQLIGTQNRRIEIQDGIFSREIAPARTFGFVSDLEYLRDMGLIRGGSLDNAVVLTDDGGVMNPEGLRFDDEFVRHKILDIIGDLAMFGMPVLGHVEAHKSGHGVHAALITRVLRDNTAWEIIEASERAALNSNSSNEFNTSETPH